MGQPLQFMFSPRIKIISIILSLTLSSNVESLDLSQCTMPLGMESGEIPDSDITASSSYENGNVGPHIGRIRTENFGGAWCPKNQIGGSSETQEFLEIDLHTTRVITITETQGRFGNGQGQEFAETYLISYWRPQLNKWIRYRDQTGNETLKGNINTYLAAKTELNPPIIASKIRIIPYSYHRRMACMRVEIYGCLYRGGLLSYSMPQGNKRGENWELYDQIYDGQWGMEGQYLQFGLGQLTDGKGGPTNFKDDFYAPERGKSWVGWKNESRNSTDPLEILFTFDSVREFNTVHIHTSNQFTKEIQVFSEARVFFSVGGKLYPGDPILYVPQEDCIFEDPKNMSIKLHQRIGRYVKIQLFWSSKWILVSEITFDSQSAMGNFTEEEVVKTTPIPVVAKVNRTRSGNIIPTKITTTLTTKDTFNSQNDVSQRVPLIDNPENSINNQVANSIVDRGPAPTMVEEFSSTTILMTAVISSCIAILLVLVMILVAFLMRHRLFFTQQEKIPPPSQAGSMHYGEVGGLLGFNNGLGGGGGIGTGSHDFGYAAPLVLLASRDPKSKSPPTMASSLSRDYDYEPSSKPSFSSFVGSNGNNNTAKSNGGGSSSSGGGGGNSKTQAEYYSCALVQNPSFFNKTDLKTNEYEYVAKDGTDFSSLVPPPTSQKSPRRSMSPNINALSSIPPLFNTSRSFRSISMRLKELGLPEIPKQNLTFLKKVGQGGIFGSIFVGELHWSSSNGKDRQLVAVKRLLRNASEKDKVDFLEEVRLLSSLNDPNVTQVLGLCTEEEPFSVALEFLELGDLCQFLRQNDTLHSTSKRKLSDGDLLHFGSQIASGMKFLEAKNICHRDLATRNCVVSRCLTVKISHFATDTGLYSADYYQIDGKMPLPIRWMAWESVFMGKYSTKSDVWSMGTCLWEILTFCRQSPYPSLTDQEVIHNLRRLSFDDQSDPFQLLDHPYNCPRDVYELMCDTWRRNDEERPSFWEIHCFLMRKNMKYHRNKNNISSHHRNASSTSINQPSYYV